MDFGPFTEEADVLSDAIELGGGDRRSARSGDPLSLLHSSAAQACLMRVYGDTRVPGLRNFADIAMSAIPGRLPSPISAARGALLNQVTRMLDARLVIALGTSQGVAAVWLACALREQGRRSGDRGVIGLEPVAAHAHAARALLRSAAVARYVDIREGAVCEELSRIDEPIDLLFIDGHPSAALGSPLSLIRRLHSRLRSGGAVIVDRIRRWPAAADWLRNPANGYCAITLPYTAGIEVSIKR